MPASQIANLNSRVEGGSHLERLAQMVDKALPLKVIEVSRYRRRLILSERAAQREWRVKQREQLFEEIEEGVVRKGVVSNLCDFGAFVDLGGADGLIHISELTWNRVQHPREVLSIGHEVEVFVLKVDQEKQRIALSLKRLQPDPWRMVEEKYFVGQIVMGTITNIVKFGAFAEIEPGIEGLIHLSELVEGGAQEPSEVVFEGEKLALQVVSIESARQRIGLSLRRVPFEERVSEGEEEMPVASTEAEPDQAGSVEVEEQEVSGLEEVPSESTPQAAEEEVVAVSLLEVDETSEEEGSSLAMETEEVEATEVEAAQVPEEEEEGSSLAMETEEAEATEAEAAQVLEEEKERSTLATEAQEAESTEAEVIQVQEGEDGSSLATDDAVAEETETGTGEIPEDQGDGESGS